MSLAVASALIHGFKDTEPIKLDEKLAGFLLISPWVSYGTDAPSWKENAELDVVPAVIQDNLGGAYVDKNERDEFSEPIRADTDWWRGIPAKSILNIVSTPMSRMPTRLRRLFEMPRFVHVDAAGATLLTG